MLQFVIMFLPAGEVYLGFETGFVFAEVNADSVTWIVKKDRNNDNYVIVSK